MIVVDTTILVYAVGGEHALRAPCRELVQRAASGEIELATTAGVLQEFAHVRARRRGRRDAAALTREWTHLVGPLLRPDAEDLLAALSLWESLADLGSFDAVLAATAVSRGAGRLASADRAFGGVPSLEWLDPADTDFLERVMGRTAGQ